MYYRKHLDRRTYLKIKKEKLSGSRQTREMSLKCIEKAGPTLKGKAFSYIWFKIISMVLIGLKFKAIEVKNMIL